MVKTFGAPKRMWGPGAVAPVAPPSQWPCIQYTYLHTYIHSYIRTYIHTYTKVRGRLPW